MIKPWKISDAEIAFGQTNRDLPSLEEFYKMKKAGQILSKYEDLVSAWFFAGLAEINPTPREGIDTDEAMRCIRAELTSWERKHQHKTMLLAWLFDQWFSDVQWKASERKQGE